MGYTEKLYVFFKKELRHVTAALLKRTTTTITTTQKKTKQKTNVIDIVQPIEKIKL